MLFSLPDAHPAGPDTGYRFNRAAAQGIKVSDAMYDMRANRAEAISAEEREKWEGAETGSDVGECPKCPAVKCFVHCCSAASTAMFFVHICVRCSRCRLCLLAPHKTKCLHNTPRMQMSAKGSTGCTWPRTSAT